MRQIHIPNYLEEFAFATEAAEAFKINPQLRTYTRSGKVREDEMFAVRWGMDDDCVLCFRVGSEPIIYTQIIKE